MVHRHISDVDTWGHPDRNYFVFVVLSVVFGFLGADHFYLRSFGTGTQKLIVNIFTLGFWYWWDLIQVLTEGSTVRKEGLSGPLDWIQGIGRGVFVDATQPTEYKAEKSYLVYAVLAIFFGWLGADKFYIGQTWQGLAKIFSCFNIFIFLLGWLWWAWDGFHAFFMTDSILKDGISAPLPFNMIFSGITSGDIFKVKEPGAAAGGETSGGGILDWIAKLFHFPSVPEGLGKTLWRDVAAPLFTPPVVAALRGIESSEKGAALATEVAPASELAVPLEQPEPGFKATINAPLPTNIPSSTPAQMGGGAYGGGAYGGERSGDLGPGPVIAGALTAVVLAGGLKGAYDFLSSR
jgi:TM2 domain-containing membrane protein YozV